MPSAAGQRSNGIREDDEPPSDFLQALWELSERHERELEAVREKLEAKLFLASRELEELRQSVAVTHRMSDNAIDMALNPECAQLEEAQDRYNTPRASTAVEAASASEVVGGLLIDNEGAGLASTSRKVSFMQLPEAEKNSPPQQRGTSRFAGRMTTRHGSQLGGQVLNDDLALIKGWKSHDKSLSDVKALSYHSSTVYMVVKQQAFDSICSLMIISNAVLMGIAVNWGAENYQEANPPMVFTVLDRAFTVWFMLEIALRMSGNGLGFFCKKDWTWNTFDFGVVVADVAMTLVAMGSESSNNGGANINIVRLLRVLRVMRALRVVRLFRFFRELRMMVFSVLRSGTSLVWSFVLFTMNTFLFAVYLTQNVTIYLREEGDSAVNKDLLIEYFGSLLKALYTLFMAVSGGISWVEISNPLLEVHWSNCMVFIFFIFFTIYALTNIITGIFVDTAIQSAQSDRDEVIQTQLQNRDSTLQQMKELFVEADEDHSGTISFSEFESHLSDKKVRAHLASLGLQLDEARGLFRLLDMDKSGTLTIDEFIFGCMRLKGCARSIDLATLMYENKKMFTIMKSFFAFVEEQLGKMDCIVHMVHEKLSLDGRYPDPGGPGCRVPFDASEDVTI